MSGQNLISYQGLRLDGRRPNELRKIKCKLGVFSQPDGSAYLEQGNTKVLAAVYGPHQTSLKKGDHKMVIVNCQYSMATFSTGERKNRPRGDRKSLEMTLHLEETLRGAINTELYPRSQIDIFIEILQVDGGSYCASVNAATLALIDAGICLKEYACACTASLANNTTALADVSNYEENAGGPTLSVASLPTSDKIVFIEMSQRFHLDHLQKVLEQALEGCRSIRKTLDDAVREHLRLKAQSQVFK